MEFFKTRALAKKLGVTYWKLFGLIQSGLIQPPPKDSSGDFIWLADDVERARAALAWREARKEPYAQSAS